MSTDRTGPLTPDERRELSALQHLIDDGPMKHPCENCGADGDGTVGKIPLFWRWMALGEGWETLADVDDNTKLLCSFCVAAMECALDESKRCRSK